LVKAHACVMPGLTVRLVLHAKGKHASVGANCACSMLYSPQSAMTAALWLKMSASGTMDMPAFQNCMISSDTRVHVLKCGISLSWMPHTQRRARTVVAVDAKGAAGDPRRRRAECIQGHAPRRQPLRVRGAQRRHVRIEIFGGQHGVVARALGHARARQPR